MLNNQLSVTSISLGQQHFNCCKPEALQAAMHAIAAAEPEHLPPRKQSHHILLLLVEPS